MLFRSEGNDRAEAQRIEALKQAIRGRLGDRFIEFFYDEDSQSVYMKYDPVCMAIKEMKGGTEYTNPVEPNRIFVDRAVNTKGSIR